MSKGRLLAVLALLLGCALLWALLVLVRLARRGLWWDRRRGTGRRARA